MVYRGRETEWELDDESWRGDFIRSAEAVTAAERMRLARLAGNGDLERVCRGVYRRPVEEREFGERRHLALVRARELLAPGRHLFVARSAAASWGIPRLDPWPERVEAHDWVVSGGRSTPGVVRRATDRPTVVVVRGGVARTSLGRTLIDTVRFDSFVSGVCSVDAVLGGIPSTSGLITASRVELLDELDQLPGQRGVATARDVLEFADGASESPGESLSRVQMHRLGAPRPELQRRFVDAEGEMFVDFFWPALGIAGEFDGRGKYGRSGDRSAEAVWAEKRREDRLRRQVSHVIRWDMPIARDRSRFGALLRSVGILC